MKINLMDIRRQEASFAAEYEAAVLDALRSGTYIGGPYVERFEEEFAQAVHAKHAISCSNGTTALILALRALQIGPGDEVITVSWTFFATAEAVAAVGATPVFVDVCPDTYCMDPASINEAITERTRAILPVHFYGHCTDMDAICAIAIRHNLLVVEDCAQAMGTEYKGRPVGTFGDAGCFSFFPTKNLGAAGDAGAVVTNRADVAKAVQAYKVHGSGIAGLEVLEAKYAARGETLPAAVPRGTSKYYNYLIGYNSRMDAIQAALLCAKLLHVPEFVESRRGNARAYNEALAGSGYTVPAEAAFCRHSYYLYVLCHPKADAVMDALKAADIGCGRYYPVPLHLQGAFAHLGYHRGDLPVTERLAATSFAIPVFPELTEEEREFIIKTLLEND